MEKGSSNGMVSGALFWDVVGFLVKVRHFSFILVLLFWCYHGIFFISSQCVYAHFHTKAMGVIHEDSP